MILPRARRRGLLTRSVLCLLLFLCALAPGASRGQVIPDTVRRPPDTLGIYPDSLAALGDSAPALRQQEAQGDSVAPQDTLPALRLPELTRPVPSGWGTGVWFWDREAILSSRAITLAELVGETPGSVLLRGGDYGMPVTVSAFGAGGDRIRVFRDGIEVIPLEGSTPDLTRIGLGGLRSVRVVRGVGELRIELERILGQDGRPLSLVEAGTGDLNTNLFRGTFAHPRAFGGSLALALDRVDTRGIRGEEPGSGSGGWIRYGLGLGSRGSVVLAYTRASSDRGELYAPGSVSRTDWSVRSRWRLFEGLVGDFYYASASLGTDSVGAFDFGTETRARWGGSLSFEGRGIRALTRLQGNTGDGLPDKSAFVEVSTALPRVGGLAGEAEWEDWGQETIHRSRVRAWTAPLFGVSLFAERSSGTWGLPYLADRPPPPPGDSVAPEEDPPPADTVPQALPGPRFADHEGTRLGVGYEWGGIFLGGALVSMKSDSLFLLGLPPDRAGVVRPGGKREGFELSARVPLYFRSLSVSGSLQWWDQEEDVYSNVPDSLSQGAGPRRELLPEEEMPWRYLPRRSYEGRISFHDTFYPTGNLEVWFDLGVRGRDPMVMPFEEVPEGGDGTDLVPTMVPFFQSWFVRLQIRVVTVRAFVMWENFTGRQRNQDFPGRVLPPTRSLYGVRWTMWN